MPPSRPLSGDQIVLRTRASQWSHPAAFRLANDGVGRCDCAAVYRRDSDPASNGKRWREPGHTTTAKRAVPRLLSAMPTSKQERRATDSVKWTISEETPQRWLNRGQAVRSSRSCTESKVRSEAAARWKSCNAQLGLQVFTAHNYCKGGVKLIVRRRA